MESAISLVSTIEAGGTFEEIFYEGQDALAVVNLTLAVSAQIFLTKA